MRIPVRIAVAGSDRNGGKKHNVLRLAKMGIKTLLCFFLVFAFILAQAGLPLIAFKAHTISVTARIEPPPCRVVDFETDASGEAILVGQKIDNEYTQWGLGIQAFNNNRAHQDWALAFDSSNPTGGDIDLGTPNEDFGGPGVGDGGKLGRPGENSAAQGNLLIIAEDTTDDNGDGLVDDPDDERKGGKLIFLFDKPTSIDYLRIFDIEEKGTKIELYDNDFNLFNTIDVPTLGDNSAQRIEINSAGVRELRVILGGSGAVDDLCFSPIYNNDPVGDEEEGFSEVGDNQEEGDNEQEQEEGKQGESELVFLNEILPNPEGADEAEGLSGEWVELYNLGSEEVDVAGWYIEDGSASGNRQVISAQNTHTDSTIIGAKDSGSEWLVVFMAGAILNNDGDSVYLYNADGRLVDSHSYGKVKNDRDADENNSPGEENSAVSGPEEEGQEGKSIARIPDGSGEWLDPVPTPGGPNKLESGKTMDTEEQKAEELEDVEDTTESKDNLDTDNLYTKENVAGGDANGDVDISSNDDSNSNDSNDDGDDGAESQNGKRDSAGGITEENKDGSDAEDKSENEESIMDSGGESKDSVAVNTDEERKEKDGEILTGENNLAGSAEMVQDAGKPAAGEENEQDGFSADASAGLDSFVQDGLGFSASSSSASTTASGNNNEDNNEKSSADDDDLEGKAGVADADEDDVGNFDHAESEQGADSEEAESMDASMDSDNIKGEDESVAESLDESAADNSGFDDSFDLISGKAAGSFNDKNDNDSEELRTLVIEKHEIKEEDNNNRNQAEENAKNNSDAGDANEGDNKTDSKEVADLSLLATKSLEAKEEKAAEVSEESENSLPNKGNGDSQSSAQ